MANSNNFRSNGGNNFSSYRPAQLMARQSNMPSTPNMNSYQPRAPLVYSQPSAMRNQLTESEPLSEYTEMQTEMHPMPVPYRQMNPQSSLQLYTRERDVRHTNSPYPRVMEMNVQNGPHPRMVDTRSQRTVSQNMRTTPYSRSQFLPQPQMQLLPPPTPRYLAPGYNPNQTFVMQAVSTPTARGSSSDNWKTPETSLFLTKVNSSTSKTATQNRKVPSVNRRRFLIGSIDQIVRWHHTAKTADLCIVYEVTATLDSLRVRSKQVYQMVLRDYQTSSVPSLQAVFHPIDRDLPQVHTGELMTFVGRMIGAKKLQVFDMWPTTAESLAGLKRISFLCQRTLQEACLSASEP